MKMKIHAMHKAFWFTGGFALGLTLISVGHASLPKANPGSNPNSNVVSEMKAPKVTAPDLEEDYSKLSNLEQRYAESWDQQQRLRSATVGAAKTDIRASNVAPVKTKKKVRQ